MRYLTKSRFALALICPTKLDYEGNSEFANADFGNEFLKALAEGGHQVGALAKCLFPDGIEVDDSGHDAQAEATERYMAREVVTLFEAAIRVGRLFIRADLLQKHGNVIDLYEVKAKGFDPTDPDAEMLGARGGFTSSMKPYLYDIAFQRYVLKKAFPTATIRAHLVMPNKAATCSQAGLAQRLALRKNGRQVSVDVDPTLRDGTLAREILCIVRVDGYLDRLEQLPMTMGGWEVAFAEGIEELARRLDVEPYPPRLGSHCKSCQFRASASDLAAGKRDGRLHCITSALGLTADQLSRPTVFDLYGRARTDALLDERKVLLADLESEDVRLVRHDHEISASHRQWLQCEESRDALPAPFVRRDHLRQEITALRYPLHFVDFETSRPALPFHAGRRAYEQLLFQFSHHRMKRDGTLCHQTQHLSVALGQLPNFDTVRALMAAVGHDEGSVLHWWDHEKTVLKEVRDQLTMASASDEPDRDALIGFIDDMVNGVGGKPPRLVDLGRMIHRNVFFPGTRGSSSLKKVLPALLASSSRLQAFYGRPVYGSEAGIPSLNFTNQTWIQRDPSGRVIDPYRLLGERSDDPDLAGLEQREEQGKQIADGGAAMVAYGLLQCAVLDEAQTARLKLQLLRYCELDTLAMVMAWEALQELLEFPVPTGSVAPLEQGNCND